MCCKTKIFWLDEKTDGIEYKKRSEKEDEGFL